MEEDFPLSRVKMWVPFSPAENIDVLVTVV